MSNNSPRSLQKDEMKTAISLNLCPNLTAVHCNEPDYDFNATRGPKTKPWGRYIEHWTGLMAVNFGEWLQDQLTIIENAIFWPFAVVSKCQRMHKKCFSNKLWFTDLDRDCAHNLIFVDCQEFHIWHIWILEGAASAVKEDWRRAKRGQGRSRTGATPVWTDHSHVCSLPWQCILSPAPLPVQKSEPTCSSVQGCAKVWSLHRKPCTSSTACAPALQPPCAFQLRSFIAPPGAV